MIRHRCGQPRTLPISLLPIAMIESAFQAFLIATIREAMLVQASLAPAVVAAIAMSSITVRADVEDRPALQPTASSLEELNPIMNCRTQRHIADGLDNGSCFMSG